MDYWDYVLTRESSVAKGVPLDFGETHEQRRRLSILLRLGLGLELGWSGFWFRSFSSALVPCMNLKHLLPQPPL